MQRRYYKSLSENDIDFRDDFVKSGRFIIDDDYIFSQAAKMKSVREALLDLRTVVAATEENYRAILSHLGSEVEIAARCESKKEVKIININ